MAESKRELGSDLAKLDATTDEDIARHMAEDDTPEVTDAQLAEAEIYEDDKFIRRVGRPKGSGTKELVTLRLDRVVLDRFRAGGPGWQTRLNDALRSMLREGDQFATRIDEAAAAAEAAAIERANQRKNEALDHLDAMLRERISSQLMDEVNETLRSFFAGHHESV